MHTVNITKLNHICKSWLDAQSSTLRAHPARTWTHLRSRAIHWRNSSWQRSNESSPWWPRPHHQRIISVEKLPVKYLKFCVCPAVYALKREFSDRFEASLVDLRSLLGWMDICTRLSECWQNINIESRTHSLRRIQMLDLLWSQHR